MVINCPPIELNHPTNATAPPHSWWKSISISTRAPHQYIRASRAFWQSLWSTMTFVQSRSAFLLQQSHPGVMWASIEGGHIKRKPCPSSYHGGMFLSVSRIWVGLIRQTGRCVISQDVQTDALDTFLIINANVNATPCWHTGTGLERPALVSYDICWWYCHY